MNTRSAKSMVTFSNAFALSGYKDELPAGDYEVIVEEELLQGLSFQAYRRTATYLLVRTKGSHVGRSEWRSTTERDLQVALSRDKALKQSTNLRNAALAPQEDLK